jgi:hypothetical protein
MDGKRRISIVIFPNCIQVISKMKHRKPGTKAGTKVFDRVLISSSDRHLRVDGRTIPAVRLQGRKQSKTLKACLSMLFPG